MTKLSYKQKQFIDLIKNEYSFVLSNSDKGWVVGDITDFNTTLYATLTMRSLLNRGVIEIKDNKVYLTHE